MIRRCCRLSPRSPSRRRARNRISPRPMPEDPQLQSDAAPAVEIAEVNEFESLLQQEFKPKTSDARQAVENAVRTLAEQALAGTALIGKDAIASIPSIIT